MDKLQAARIRIDEIDLQLVRLIEERLNLTRQVAQYKIDHQMEVFQPAREQVVLEKVVDHLQDKSYSNDLQSLYQHIMNISKAKQLLFIPKPIIHNTQGSSGYFGEPYSYSYLAHQALFEQEGYSYLRFKQAFQALENKEIDALVVPLENAITGLVLEVIDGLQHLPFYITQEYYLNIDHVLVGLESASLEDIVTVYSHPQALSQCNEYLSLMNWRTQAEFSTSESAHFVKQSNQKQFAAIASREAGQAYGLKVLAQEIQNHSNNQTRFVVLKREPSFVHSSKVSIMFSLDNHSGTLATILNKFKDASINLIKIESRPSHQSNWEYYSIVDFEGDISDPKIKALIDQIKHMCIFYKFLGAF